LREGNGNLGSDSVRGGGRHLGNANAKTGKDRRPGEIGAFQCVEKEEPLGRGKKPQLKNGAIVLRGGEKTGGDLGKGMP